MQTIFPTASAERFAANVLGSFTHQSVIKRTNLGTMLFDLYPKTGVMMARIAAKVTCSDADLAELGRLSASRTAQSRAVERASKDCAELFGRAAQ